MLRTRTRHDEILVGPHRGISFQRTLRIPDDNRAYPLPPGLGQFPMKHVDDYAEKVPTKWLEHGGVFLPIDLVPEKWTPRGMVV